LKKQQFFYLVVAAALTLSVASIDRLSAAVYLPIILKYYNSNCPAIPNGDFEGGNNGVWTTYSFNGFENELISDSDYLPINPHGGNWAVWFGGAVNETAYIQQSVTIPASCPYLTYWYWIESDEIDCGGDFARVRINGNDLDSLNLCINTNTGGWARRSINLGPYAGQGVILQFFIYVDSSESISSLYIDDVSFSSSITAGSETNGILERRK
jgi:hypothetical protein